MSIDELRELISTLRQLGVTHYKCGDVELALGAQPEARSAQEELGPAPRQSPADVEAAREAARQLKDLPNGDSYARLFGSTS